MVHFAGGCFRSAKREDKVDVLAIESSACCADDLHVTEVIASSDEALPKLAARLAQSLCTRQPQPLLVPPLAAEEDFFHQRCSETANGSLHAPSPEASLAHSPSAEANPAEVPRPEADGESPAAAPAGEPDTLPCSSRPEPPTGSGSADRSSSGQVADHEQGDRGILGGDGGLSEVGPDSKPPSPPLAGALLQRQWQADGSAAMPPSLLRSQAAASRVAPAPEAPASRPEHCHAPAPADADEELTQNFPVNIPRPPPPAAAPPRPQQQPLRACPVRAAASSRQPGASGGADAPSRQLGGCDAEAATELESSRGLGTGSEVRLVSGCSPEELRGSLPAVDPHRLAPAGPLPATT